MCLHLDCRELYLELLDNRIVLAGPALQAYHNRSQNDPSISPEQARIELLNAQEFLSLPGTFNWKDVAVPLDHVYCLSSVENGKTFIFSWNHGNAWRSKFRLKPKSFYLHFGIEPITDTSVSSLYTNKSTVNLLVDDMSSLSEIALDHLFLCASDDGLKHMVAERLITAYPHSYRGYMRLAALSKQNNPKLSILCYAQASCFGSARLRKTIDDSILSLRYKSTWGSLATEAELERIPEPLRRYLLLPWPQNLATRFGRHIWQCPVEKRTRTLYKGEVMLPRFFSWLYPGRIAGMSFPKDEETIDVLNEMGFTHVLTLSRESPVKSEWFDYKAIESLSVPVPNYQAPTLAEMDYIWSQIAAGGTWVIHCGGGVGRAGCVLACVIAMLGTDPSEANASDLLHCLPQLDGQTAIRTLRYIRPNSLETLEQETFVLTWVSHRWKMSSASSVEPISLTPLRFVIANNHVNDFRFDRTHLLILVGLPGSGKSWVAAAVQKRRQRGTTVIISQDESGSRSACEAEIGRKYKNGTLLILDRCNVSSQDRQAWLSLCTAGVQTVAVNFDCSLEVCRSRIDSRVSHPTIRPGRGVNALRQMNSQMEKASLQENYAAVVTISNFQASRDFVKLIGGEPGIIKFPRTPHLLDLGAATADDEVLPSFMTIESTVCIEEKIDGANMGFSLDYDGRILCQNRSHYINPSDHIQFKALGIWIDDHAAMLHALLDKDSQMPERYILYGEWCAARHSVAYTRLPDRFLAYDLYDRHTETFISRSLLTTALSGTTIKQVPLMLRTSHLTRTDVMLLLERQSQYSDDLVEGVYIRFEDAAGRQTLKRGKIVRQGFTQSIEQHWSKRHTQWNSLLGQIYE